jgi:hypothetical protein
LATLKKRFPNGKADGVANCLPLADNLTGWFSERETKANPKLRLLGKGEFHPLSADEIFKKFPSRRLWRPQKYSFRKEGISR